MNGCTPVIISVIEFIDEHVVDFVMLSLASLLSAMLSGWTELRKNSHE